MPRNGEKAHRRLQAAALELFVERGYDQTTAAAIAARAGVTARTFYRHFPDKRETLFDGQAAFQATLIEAIAAASPQEAPLRVLWGAFSAVEPLFEANRPFAAPRAAVIAATPALRERELGKISGMIEALAAALVQRGVGARQARLAVQAALAAFDQAMSSWVEDSDRSLRDHLGEAFEELHALSSGVASVRGS
jgi:AcrR family transcriptional regulator